MPTSSQMTFSHTAEEHRREHHHRPQLEPGAEDFRRAAPPSAILNLQSFTRSTSLFSSTLRVCLVGNRTVRNDNFETCAKTQVVKNVTVTTDLWDVFCPAPNATCENYFALNDVSEVQAVPGLLSGVIRGERTC